MALIVATVIILLFSIACYFKRSRHNNCKSTTLELVKNNMKFKTIINNLFKKTIPVPGTDNSRLSFSLDLEQSNDQGSELKVIKNTPKKSDKESKMMIQY